MGGGALRLAGNKKNQLIPRVLVAMRELVPTGGPGSRGSEAGRGGDGDGDGDRW